MPANEPLAESEIKRLINFFDVVILGVHSLKDVQDVQKTLQNVPIASITTIEILDVAVDGSLKRTDMTEKRHDRLVLLGLKDHKSMRSTLTKLSLNPYSPFIIASNDIQTDKIIPFHAKSFSGKLLDSLRKLLDK